MRTFIRLAFEDAAQSGFHELVPGDVIGRHWKCALCVSDPLVSEAHAMVSLRDGGLKLLGLRGRLAVNGRLLTEVRLSPGLVIGLSPRTSLRVGEVSVSPEGLALEHPELGRRVLGGTVSISRGPPLTLSAGADPDALAVVWGDGLGWVLMTREGSRVALVPDGSIDLDGMRVAVRRVGLEASGAVTATDRTSDQRTFLLVARYDTVHLHVDGSEVLALDGLVARIVSELVVAGGPLHWQPLARDLWPAVGDARTLRRNWDAALVRLRKKLGAAKLRTDLVESVERTGEFRLVLRPGDRVEDRT